MKVVICLIVVVAGLLWSSVAAAEGPLDKGAVQIGGTAYVSTVTSDLSFQEYTQVALAPTIGVFVAPGVLIGTHTSIAYTDQTINYWQIAVGPSLSLFFGDVQRSNRGRTVPYVSADFAYTLTKYSGHDFYDISASLSGFSIGGNVGATYFIRDGVALDFGVRFQYDRSETLVYYPYIVGDPVSGIQMMAGIGLTTFVY